jgi:hypothetical protein
MTEQIMRLKETNQPLICRECHKEFRGAEVRQHTEREGYAVFDLKSASIPEKEETE